MAKRRFSRVRRRRSPRYSRYRRRVKPKGSLIQLLGAAAPQIMANTGVPNIGYSITENGLSIQERAQRFAANEVLLFTGYDTIGRGWVWQAPVVNYGLMFALPMLLKKVFHSKNVSVPMLGNVKVL